MENGENEQENVCVRVSMELGVRVCVCFYLWLIKHCKKRGVCIGVCDRERKTERGREHLDEVG